MANAATDQEVKKVCAWCGTSIDDSKCAPEEIEALAEKSAPEDPRAEERANHGCCEKCMEEFLQGSGKSLGEYLNDMAPPVFLVNQDRQVLGANLAAEVFVDKDQPDFAGQLKGEVFDCVNSVETGGCGKQIHCQACVIKNSIEKTAKTGEAVHNAPATMVLGSDNPKNVRFEISTWKAGEVVFLRIDDFLS